MRKVCLVTGSSRGIGRATILKFAENGYDVVINYNTSEQEALKVKEKVEKDCGVKAAIFKADVSSEQQVAEMFSFIKTEFGRIDVVVNNAGVVFDREFEDITVEQFKRTLDVNLLGAFLVSRYASQLMRAGGAIVNVSSTSGTKVFSPECLDYNLSKIGLQSLTRDLAFQFKPKIRVNAIAIGWADTDMNKDLPKEYISQECDKIYLGRFAKPREVANVIYFLASEESSYVNAEVIVVDGGY